MAMGLASSSTNRQWGGLPSMRGSGCILHRLKALDKYLLRMYCFNFGRLPLVGAQDRVEV